MCRAARREDGTAIITYPIKETPSPNQQWILIEVKK